MLSLIKKIIPSGKEVRLRCGHRQQGLLSQLDFVDVHLEHGLATLPVQQHSLQKQRMAF